MAQTPEQKAKAWEVQQAKDKFKREWSVHWRGDYCRSLKSCEAMKAVKCDGCTDYDAIFKGVDPAKLGRFMQPRKTKRKPKDGPEFLSHGMVSMVGCIKCGEGT